MNRIVNFAVSLTLIALPGRRPPDPGSGDAHGPKAETMDLDVAADFEGS
jgi:hypothetical protein